MATVLCVLYADPVDGYPPRTRVTTSRTSSATSTGKTTPTPEEIDFTPGELLGSVSGELGLRTLSRGRRAHLHRHLGQGRPRLGLRARAAERRRRDLAAVLARLSDRRANREGPSLKLAITAGIGSDHVDLAGGDRARDHRRRGHVLEQHQRLRARSDDDPGARPQLHPLVPVGRRRRLEHRRLRHPLVRPRGHAGRHGRRRPDRLGGAAPPEAVRGRAALHRPAPAARPRSRQSSASPSTRPPSRWSRSATSSRSTHRCIPRPSTCSTTS